MEHLTNQQQREWTLDKCDALKKMWEIRIFEELLHELYQTGVVHGTMHLCIGQEATAVGGVASLRQDDLLFSSHRNHGHALAKGTSAAGMFAEILGKVTGTNRGKGGSMHIADVTVGNLGSNGIVGGQFPLAAGAALAAQMQKTDQVVLCYAGDGATNEGSFHEALNLAAIWQLPVVYFIENNQYGLSSSIQEMVNVARLSERGAGYGIPSVTIDGNDLTLVAQTVNEAVARAREGAGPTLIEAVTYRHMGHSKSDQLLYRSEAEVKNWQQSNDPIDRLEQEIMQAGLMTWAEIQALVKETRQELEETLARVQTDPEPTIEELWQHVYAEENK